MPDFLVNILLTGAFLWTYFLFLVEIRAESSCIDVTNNIGLKSSQFWQGKADDVTECASMCVLRKICNSINYDTSSKWCELNSGLKSTTPTKTGKYLVYSEFKDWPKEINQHCQHRPCSDDEVCIPGSILASAKTDPNGCTYSCMSAGRAVCPMPPFGVSNGRTVGSVNEVTCDKGYVGGGNATCLPDKKWDKDIPPCQEILGYGCKKTDPLCSQIKALCVSGKCSCGLRKVYVEWIAECVTATTQWVQKVVEVSSEDSIAGYRRGAEEVVGPTNRFRTWEWTYRNWIYSNVWAQKVLDSEQYIEIRFDKAMNITGVKIYGTYSTTPSMYKGGIRAIKAKSAGSDTWTTLWSFKTVQAVKYSRMFAPQLSIMEIPSRDLRIEVDCTVGGKAVEIDAVLLVGTRVV